ncbi:hypothetical protein VPHD164_0021 [Vibrio phage D164]
MFENLTEVPAVLQGFYHEEVRTEQVFDEDGEPVLNEVVVTFTNDDGEEVEGVRHENVYHDVTYLVLNDRGQIESIEGVFSVAEKHSGCNDDVLDTFIGFYLNGLQWSFYDEYMAWLEAEPFQEDYTKEEPNYDDTFETVYDQDAFNEAYHSWVNNEPEVMSDMTVRSFKVQHFARLRRAAYGGWHEQLEMQSDGTWLEHIAKIKSQYPKE